jgi:hypothetical protein
MAMESGNNKGYFRKKVERTARNLALGAALVTPLVGNVGSAQEPEPVRQAESQKGEKVKETKAQRIEREKQEKIKKLEARIAIAKKEAELRKIQNPAKGAVPSAGDQKVFRENRADKKYILKEVNVLDEKGNKIGTLIEGSEAYVKLRKLQIEKETGVEKEKARNQLIFPGNMGGFDSWRYNNSGYDRSDEGVNTGGGGWVRPYNNPGGRYGLGTPRRGGSRR